MTPLDSGLTVLEPELISIPTGEFCMGTDRLSQESAGIEWKPWMERETPPHRLYLPEYAIAKYPVTNAQYKCFVDAEGHRLPSHWINGVIPAGRADHPVVNVSWHNAVAYCKWLKQVTGQSYQLPSEAEWEKAARGTDGRLWPWGNQWNPDKCNSPEKGPRHTTSVGQYSRAGGNSPYGVADMAGNAWEWTRSLYKEYPYDSGDGRENPEASGNRVLRGGSFASYQAFVRSTPRLDLNPLTRWWYSGFRVVVAAPFSPNPE